MTVEKEKKYAFMLSVEILWTGITVKLLIQEGPGYNDKMMMGVVVIPIVCEVLSCHLSIKILLINHSSHYIMYFFIESLIQL